MSDTSPFGFGKFVPGFDFLQNLAKGTSGSIPKIPNLGNWVAPTLSVEELDKRIDELKAVQFWLEQNSRALTATVQALEVQKMTLATLKGMNVSMTDMAAAFTPKAAPAAAGKAQEATASAPKPVSAAPAEPPAAAPAAASAPGASAAAVVDPMQWWGALTQQFQQIATSAMQEASKQAALAPAQNLAAGAQDAMKDAMKAATDMATQGVQTLQSAARSATRTPAASKATAAAKPAAKAAAPAASAPAAKKSSPRRPAKPAAR